MIWNLQIKLLEGAWADGDWQATVALDEATTLEDLHGLIQRVVGFDNDHLYSFFVARTPRSWDRVVYDEEEEANVPWEVPLNSLFPLAKHRKLFYLFDYGDNWVFQVSRTRHKPYEAEPGAEYPKVIAEQGDKPVQYPALEE